MKHTVVFLVKTTYNDGAGNSCVYWYTIGSNKITNTAGNSWRMRAFKLSKPSASVIITSNFLSSSAGSPPAYTTRTMTISSAGVYSFKDADETVNEIAATTTLSDVEEGAYETISAAVLETSGLSTATISGVDCLSTFIPVTYYADTNTFTVTFGTSSPLLATKTLPVLTFVIAETNLVTREYTGMYAELTAKAIVTVTQMLNKRYEGAVAQAAAYARSGNSPMALELVGVLHEWKVGVLQ